MLVQVGVSNIRWIHAQIKQPDNSGDDCNTGFVFTLMHLSDELQRGKCRKMLKAK